MKKTILPLLLSFALHNESQACSWYEPDHEYFNLFTQSIIRDKTFTPFLLTYSNAFYNDEKIIIPDDNIEAWQKFFGKKLNYKETDHLVKHVTLTQLNQLKAGRPTEPLLVKLGSGFYQQFKEAIDYLIEAKHLEPYMRINFIESEDSFYYRGDEDVKNATHLDYNKTISALQSLYSSAKNPEIKLRYGYQLVRFNHYTRNYQKAIDAFKTYVEPLKLNSAPYYLALDQYAGALRGLNKNEDANWNFFQVLKNTKYRKADSYASLKLGDSTTFNNLLQRATTKEDKATAYFLLGYQSFNSPMDVMDKIYELDPNSETLKVLTARSINELERKYLPTYYYSNESAEKVTSDEGNPITPTSNKSATTTEEKKASWWTKIVNFFKNLFSNAENSGTTERSNSLSDKKYLNNPNRIPFLNKSEYSEESLPKDYIEQLEEFTDKIQSKDQDEFWPIAQAYIKFLQKDYDSCRDILSKIKTNNKEYQAQIAKMQMLNEIVSQPKITPEFEEKLMTIYKDYFVAKPVKIDSNSEDNYYEDYKPTTQDFLNDILANRYFLQGEDAKSYLMNNNLSDFRFNPDPELAKKLHEFYNKKDKTTFEQQIVAKNMDDVGDINAYFNLIYGDQAMREAQFSKAASYYKNASDFKGYALPSERYNENTQEYEKITDFSGYYDGFKNVDEHIFGHNTMVSYNSPVTETMKKETFTSEFGFIKPKMTKYELALAASELEKIGKENSERGTKANQLIGNLLYNTSILGYFRELFVMDIDNSNGGKYYFGQTKSPFQYYYKNFTSKVYIKPDNFDLSINYYKKALQNSKDNEQKAQILFQMASAEQGKFYQYEAANTPDIDYNDPEWSEKYAIATNKILENKQKQYKTYFRELKQNYGNTLTSRELLGSCSYYHYFMTK